VASEVVTEAASVEASEVETEVVSAVVTEVVSVEATEAASVVATEVAPEVVSVVDSVANETPSIELKIKN